MKEEKEFGLSGPMYYVSMDITKKGGKFTIDDKSGWYWSGTDDTFLTGLIRIQKSKMYNDFLEQIRDSDITKSDIKNAILSSLKRDKKDGLYPLLGDNRVYEGHDSFIDSLWSDSAEEIKGCLEKHNYDKDFSEKVSDDIVSDAVSKLPSSHEIFNKYETELSKDFLNKKKPWKDVVKGIVDACNRSEKTVDNFIKCIGDEISEFNLDDPETVYEREYEAWSSNYRITDKSISEISEKHGIPAKLLDHCSHGGYEVIEKYKIK
jgi:hypothetical protein